jgi:hypothetical protein
MIERVIPVLVVGPFGFAILGDDESGVKGFGDNETNGKVTVCEEVKLEDVT